MDRGCEDRFCNSYQHGLANWMKQELASTYAAIETQHERMTAMMTELGQANQQLEHMEQQFEDLERDLEQVTNSRDEMTRHVVNTRITNRAMRNELDAQRGANIRLVIANQNLTTELEKEQAAGKGLAKALRARIAEQGEWLSKKAKKE